MQKWTLLPAVLLLFAACKKNQEGSPSPIPSIVGKWSNMSVTVIPLDSNANAINNGTSYPEPSYYYFQFNADSTWVENLAPDTNSGLAERGNYALHGNTLFTLINRGAPTKAVDCTIDTLTTTVFVFAYRRSTSYNGITPGYLEYIFHLKK